jgi:asparagine synthase (glutamine-hydrolysing)
MQLMSDVPLGMFLSGGVDSSAIAALIQRSAKGPVKTFAVGYREAPYSELSYAAEVARAIGTEHHETVLGRDDFFGALPRLIWHEDEPIAWPSSIALYFVSKLASEHVRVVLTGEGSDEIFGTC